jgi:succinyl-CoA synthetase beta subunit
MNLHEYQAKALLKKFGVNVPVGIMAENAEQAKNAAVEVRNLSGCSAWAVKAQIHAGGRGKGGGVKIAQSIDEVAALADKIIGMQLVTHQTGAEGKTVHRVLVEQGIFYPGKSEVKEFYISILLNRSTGQNIILYSTEGGMDIEEVAERTPHLLFKEEIDPLVGVRAHTARRVAYNLGLEGNAFNEMLRFLPALYSAHIALDAAMIEINPLFKTSDDKLLAADAKMRIDDNALFRHPDIAMMRDETEEDESEVEASKSNLNFVKLDGNVGCMVNGAGLAMATMDIIKYSGGMPANFLDVGGKANAQTVEAGFRILLHDPAVKAIFINIFGGIVRCDRVAQGVVDAYKSIGSVNVPVIVRLQGTNAQEAKALIDNSGLKVQSAITLAEAAEKVKRVFDTAS